MRRISRSLKAFFLALVMTFMTVSGSCLTSAEESELLQPEAEGQWIFSDNWEDYVGDVETFVYGLITTELGYIYDVFPAYVDLSSGLSVSGIAYTDYSECFANEDESEVCFEAGFIPYEGELDIPEEDFEQGLEIYPIDSQVDGYSFLLAYESSPFKEHCVVYGQYVVYGISDEGQIFYESKDYVRGECDEECGALYSYDEGKYVYDPEVGEYSPVNGISLSSQIDYEALEEEINRILEQQDTNFVSIDVNTCLYAAQEAVETYLLSMQEETFLGYDVAYLAAMTQELDPLECYRITSEGLMTIDMVNTEETAVKWMVGTACVIAVAVGIVGSMVCVECPVLSAACGSLTGLAIETFMEVVVQGESLDQVDWKKVALAAASGAVSGFLGPYIAATSSGMGEFLLDSVVDGLIGATEQTIEGWMAGEEGLELVESFGYGFAIGFGLSCGFKAVGKVVEKLAKSGVVKNAGKWIKDKIPKKITAKISDISKAVSSKIYGMKEAVDKTVFHSKYISRCFTGVQLTTLQEDGSSELKKMSFQHLKKDGILDPDGNPITKKELLDVFDSAENGEVIGRFKIEDDFIDIRKENGMISIFYDESKYQSVNIETFLTKNQKLNFDMAAAEYQKEWLKNEDLIPDSIKEGIERSKRTLEDLSPHELSSIIQKSSYVLHEEADLKTVILIPKAIHNTTCGGISHMGGVGLAKYLKNHMGAIFFKQFLSAASTGVVIAY